MLDFQNLNIFEVLKAKAPHFPRVSVPARRYEGELLSSFGHPVPHINGHLQAAGSEAAARQLEFAPSETGVRYALDLSSAYPDSGAERVVRAYDYRWAGAERGGGLTVTDTVTFSPSAEKEADFPLITFEGWTQIDESSIQITPKPAKDGSDGLGVTVTVTAHDENGHPVPLRFSEMTVGENDPSVKKKPSRPAWAAELSEGRVLTITMRSNSRKADIWNETLKLRSINI